ncbi:hypothetical protein KJ840_03325 [Patescibacteria group bacterium]|nr:hypothetical protein [Patescibacteria group bacterium]
MTRKANRVKLENINQETMSKNKLEYYFTAIQQRFEEQDQMIQQRFEEQDQMIQQRFEEQDQKFKSILDIVGFYDTERKDIKSTLWEHERRLIKLEKQSA